MVGGNFSHRRGAEQGNRKQDGAHRAWLLERASSPLTAEGVGLEKSDGGHNKEQETLFLL